MKADYDRPDLIELSRLDDAAFRQFFVGTPVKRSGRNNFIRNVLTFGQYGTAQAAHIEAVEARLTTLQKWCAHCNMALLKWIARGCRMGRKCAAMTVFWCTRIGGGARMNKQFYFSALLRPIFGTALAAKAGTYLRPAAMQTKRRDCTGWASMR